MPTPADLDKLLDGWQGRPTVAVIDLDVLRENVRRFKKLVAPPTWLMAVVKAAGYGHGSVPVAKAALAAGADELGVATVDEGARLRDAGIDAPILVLGPVGINERCRALSKRLTLVASDLAFARGVETDKQMLRMKQPAPVHLKIDTGMRRFGASPEDSVEIARFISDSPHLDLAAVMTHFAGADDTDPAFTMEQARRFDSACEAIRSADVIIPQVHLANSAATIRFPELHRDRVRVGIAMYGLRPGPDVDLPDGVKPVMTVHSRLARVFAVQPGESIGYGRQWSASEPTMAGLVPLGYADGYRRHGSDRYWMSVNGRRSPVLGRISMDQTVVEVDSNARTGDRVIVVGNGTDGVAPTLNDLATLIDTIPYELATGLVAPRLPHLYVQQGELVAIADVSGYREIDPTALGG
ncbi:alanine racemase [soil metagenome]